MFKRILSATLLSLLPLSLSAAVGQVALFNTQTMAPMGGIHLEDSPEGLVIVAAITGLPAGEHGFYIHEHASCAESNHYNPMGQQGNGTPVADLGNIFADREGIAVFNAVLPALSLVTGPYTIAGRSFIIHALPDSDTQSEGEVASRIGCGTVITIG